MSTLFDVQRVPRNSLVSLMVFVNKSANELFRYESFNGVVAGQSLGGNVPFYDSGKLRTTMNNYQAVSVQQGISTSEKIR